MFSMTQTLEPPLPPSSHLQPLPELLKRYSEEQVRLYFFPFPERPIRKLVIKLLLWLALIFGLLIMLVLLYVRFIGAADTRQGVTTAGLFAIILIVLGLMNEVWIITKYIIPLAHKLQQEYSEYLSEQMHLQRNPPPSEKAYEQWMRDIRDKVYEMAPEKLHLPMTEAYREWEDAMDAGLAYEMPPEKWQFEADLQVRGFVAPSSEEENSPLPARSKPVSRWASRLGKTHYSINVFARLFVTEDYITIYTNTINVREPEREQEKSEHCYHQHLSYISLEIDSRLVGQSLVRDQNLLLTLDSGYTIKLNVATAKLYAGNREAKIGVDEIHGGLLDVLHDHKMSAMRSTVEASVL